MNKKVKFSCTAAAVLGLGYLAAITTASTKVWKAHEPSADIFWYAEAQPHSEMEKEKAAREYFMNRKSETPQQIMQELEQIGAHCEKSDAHSTQLVKPTYICIYKIMGLLWDPYPINWEIEIFTEPGTNTISHFHAHRWYAIPERAAATAEKLQVLITGKEIVHGPVEDTQ
jgi:hypothetical protein